MADTNTLKTRILLRNDITTNREISTLVLLKGEAYIDYYTKALTNDDGIASTIPQQKIYFGDGVSQLKDLRPAALTPEETEQLIENGEYNISAIPVPAVPDDEANSTLAQDAYAKIQIGNKSGSSTDFISVKGAGSIKVEAVNDVITLSDKELADRVTDVSNAGKLTIVEDTSDAGYAKQYKFYQGTKTEKKDDGNGNITETEVPDRLLGTISLLKDMVVSKAELLKITQEDIDAGTYDGTDVSVPSTYIALTIANSDNTVLYLDVRTLVNDYEPEAGAEEIQIMISENHKISASVVRLKTSKLTDDPDCTLILDGGSSV
ncbi:MAG: hypothetical protein HFH68_00235 [Lachnospiraceae bacterium]|nr:hypothetical protein [Lachnospiraceae bacterium]